MASSQEERYIRIARACLKAINQAASGAQSRQEQVQAVYDAIHHAFESELTPYHDEIHQLRSTLEAIAEDKDAPEHLRNQARQALSNGNVSPPGQPIH